jgi:hypothetical protein
MPSTTLSTRRAAAETHIAELERESGAALLDKQAFDPAPLAAARAELAALDAAEAEAARRKRGAAAEARAEARARARETLAELLENHIRAAARAEEQARAMVGELRALEDLAETMRRTIRAVGGIVPVALEPNQIRAQHSAMLATQLRSLGGQCHFGALRWNSVAPIHDLKAHTQNYVARAIAPYLEENI